MDINEKAAIVGDLLGDTIELMRDKWKLLPPDLAEGWSLALIGNSVGISADFGLLNQEEGKEICEILMHNVSKIVTKALGGKDE